MLHAHDCLARKHIVDLIEIDVLEAEGGELEDLGDNECWADSHDARGNADDGRGDEFAKNEEAGSLGDGATGEGGGGGASETWKALPAWVVPSFPKAGFSLPRRSSVTPSPIPKRAMSNRRDERNRVRATVISVSDDFNDLFGFGVDPSALRAASTSWKQHAVNASSGIPGGAITLVRDTQGKQGTVCVLALQNLLAELAHTPRSVALRHALDTCTDTNVDLPSLNLVGDLDDGRRAR